MKFALTDIATMKAGRPVSENEIFVFQARAELRHFSFVEKGALSFTE